VPVACRVLAGHNLAFARGNGQYRETALEHPLALGAWLRALTLLSASAFAQTKVVLPQGGAGHGRATAGGQDRLRRSLSDRLPHRLELLRPSR